jgi:hypothetical protein
LSSIQQHMKSMEWIISTSHQNWLAARPPSFPAVCDNHFENRCTRHRSWQVSLVKRRAATTPDSIQEDISCDDSETHLALL